MILLIIFIFLNLTVINPAVFNNKLNYAEAQKPVAKRKLIVFSGSDWCKNCIRFKKDVLSSEVFIRFAKNNIEIVTADFPQRAKLSREEVTRNEALAEKYNVEGEFPRLVLLSEDESGSTVIPYISQSPEQFVAELKNYLAQ